MKIDLLNFQTPHNICDYMCSLIDGKPTTILEPTPGAGNLVNAIGKNTEATIFSPGYFSPEIGNNDFWKMDHKIKYDYVLMNPPFTPMAQGILFLEYCMKLSDNIISVIPWLLILNSPRRTKMLFDYGLVSITQLPRTTFKNSRIQCCIIKLKKDYAGKTEFINFPT